MLKLLCAAVGAAALFCASSAGAAITVLTFTGIGKVTYVQPGSFLGFPIPPPGGLAFGDPVVVVGSINLGDGSQPALAPIIEDGYTGTVTLSWQALKSGYQSFSFNVIGGGVGATSSSHAVDQGATLQLLNGHLQSISLGVFGDPEVNYLSNRTFGFASGSARWGGRWSYGDPDAVVPEPSTWAMLIAGFGLTGATLRLRRGRPLGRRADSEGAAG
jgi:hypothetical protein